jgi:hypothetical protein
MRSYGFCSGRRFLEFLTSLTAVSVGILLGATTGLAQSAPGSTTTVAGGGSALSFASSPPAGLALDPSGNLFVCDSLNSVVWCVDQATGFITAAAGNGTAGFSGDGGLAIGANLSLANWYGVKFQRNVTLLHRSKTTIRQGQVVLPHFDLARHGWESAVHEIR